MFADVTFIKVIVMTRKWKKRNFSFFLLKCLSFRVFEAITKMSIVLSP